LCKYNKDDRDYFGDSAREKKEDLNLTAMKSFNRIDNVNEILF